MGGTFPHFTHMLMVGDEAPFTSEKTGSGKVWKKRMEMENNKGCARCAIPDVTVYPSLSMVYPPRQVWRSLYNADEGLCVGTIFRELDLPFRGGCCQRMGDYRR